MEGHLSGSWIRRGLRFVLIVVGSMLAGKVIETLTSPTELREIQEQAAHAVEQFSPWEMMSRYIDMIDGEWDRRKEREMWAKWAGKKAIETLSGIKINPSIFSDITVPPVPPPLLYSFPPPLRPQGDHRIPDLRSLPSTPPLAFQLYKPVFTWGPWLPVQALYRTLSELVETSRTVFVIAVIQLVLGAALTLAIRLSVLSKEPSAWFWFIVMPIGSVLLGSVLAGVVVVSLAFVTVTFHGVTTLFYQVGFYIAAGVEFGKHCIEVAAHKKIETVIEKAI